MHIFVYLCFFFDKHNIFQPLFQQPKSSSTSKEYAMMKPFHRTGMNFRCRLQVKAYLHSMPFTATLINSVLKMQKMDWRKPIDYYRIVLFGWFWHSCVSLNNWLHLNFTQQKIFDERHVIWSSSPPAMNDRWK